MTLLTAIKT